MGRSRDIATILSKTEADNTSNLVLLNTTSTVSGVDSAEVQSIGLLSFSTLDSLPVNNLEAGQQAYVTGTNRLYVSNGSGWFNVALINATPSLTIDPTGTIVLATDGTPTVITLTATDSDTPSGSITFSVESDGSFSGLGRISQDSSVFTITPKIEDSATTTSSTLTFKASDGINFGSGTTALSLTFSASLVDSSSATRLLLNAFKAGNNKGITDLGTNSLTITNQGTVENQTFSPYRSGENWTDNATSSGGWYSTFFDNSRWIALPGSNDFVFGTGNFTIEWWQYWAGQPLDSYLTILDNNYGTNPNITIQTDNTYNGNLIVYTNGTSNTITESGTPPYNEWIHYAVVRNGNTLTLYRNGVANGTVDVTGVSCGSNVLGAIGARRSTGTSALRRGYLSDFRIVKGTAIYTGGFTPPTEPLPDVSGRVFHALSGPYHHDLEGHAIGYNDADNPPEIAGFSPYNRQAYDKSVHGSSLFFPERSDGFLQCTLADVGTGDVTIEGWVYFNDMNSNHTIFTANHGSGTDLFDLYWQSQSAEFKLYSNSSTVGTLASGYYPPIEEWIHVCLYRSGTTVTFYINGVQKGQITDANYNANLNGTFNIGSYSNSGSELLSGNLADFCVTTGQKYSTVPFTPPTSPIASGNSNQKLHLTGEGISIGDHSQFSREVITAQYGSSGTFNTVFGNTGTTKFGTASIYINGSAGGIVIEQPSGTQTYNGIHFHDGNSPLDFTMETWVYLPTGNPGFGDYNTLFHCGDGLVGGTGTFTQWSIFPNGQLTYYRDSTAIMSAGSSNYLSADTWHHVAFTKDGASMNMWLDGTSVAYSNTGLTNYPGSDTSSIGIGCRRHGSSSGTYPMKGYLEDFRITIGECRYSSTFTPPGKLLG